MQAIKQLAEMMPDGGEGMSPEGMLNMLACLSLAGGPPWQELRRAFKGRMLYMIAYDPLMPGYPYILLPDLKLKGVAEGLSHEIGCNIVQLRIVR